MGTIKISEEEAQRLLDYVESVKHINIVDCIYILPYLNEASEEVIDVTTIVNYFASYNPKENYDEFTKRVKGQVDEFELTLRAYQEEFKDGRLDFTQAKDDDYSLALMHKRELFAERELVSGTIIYDKNASEPVNKSTNRKSASRYLQPFNNTLTIENPEVLKARGLLKY